MPFLFLSLFCLFILGRFGYPELKKWLQANTSEGDTQITRNLGILLLIVTLSVFVQRLISLFIFILDLFPKQKKSSNELFAGKI